MFESIRFMYPQIVRSVNRLNNKGMLIKERSLADERIVLIKINKIQYNTIKKHIHRYFQDSQTKKIFLLNLKDLPLDKINKQS